MTSKVYVYEDNAGGLWLWAEGGDIVYRGGIEDAAGELEHVATHPNGSANWNSEDQISLMDADLSNPIAAYVDGRIIPGNKAGLAGEKYLQS